ncbi:hypothetical protein FJZ23_03260 [Candidatus Parcubacteria bacterium]|nr:hypothetical protein [Candidatus Parcubacteria bacterium]
MPKFTYPILLIALVLVALPMSVGAITSASYRLFPEQGFQSLQNYATNTSSGSRLQSTNYRLDGSLDSYVGRGTSSSYRQDSGSASFQYYCGDGFIDPGEICDGADLNGQTCGTLGFASGTLSCSSTCTRVTSACNTASSSGSGGGGGAAAPVSAPSSPSVSDAIKSLAYSYKPTFLLYGTTATAVTSVKVNGSSEGVTLPSPTSWQKTLSLAYGLNTFKIKATNTGGDSTESVFELYRRLVGDITQDNKVNDYDLSKLVKLWGGSDRGGDFNEDKSVNDYDFSMMVARWGTSV